MIKDRRN